MTGARGLGWWGVALLVCWSPTDATPAAQAGPFLARAVDQLWERSAAARILQQQPRLATWSSEALTRWHRTHGDFLLQLQTFRRRLNQSATALAQDLAAAGLGPAQPPLANCCALDTVVTGYEGHHFGSVAVDVQISCTLPGSTLAQGDYPHLRRAFRDHFEAHERDGLRWQYAMYAGGLHLEYPASPLGSQGICGLTGDARHRAVFRHAVQPHTRPSVIILDRGLSPAAFELARAGLRYVAALLSAADWVSVIALSDGLYFPLAPDCSFQSLLPASPEANLNLLKFINVVQPTSAPTDLALAWAAIPTLLHNTRDLDRERVLNVIIISDRSVDLRGAFQNVFHPVAVTHVRVAPDRTVPGRTESEGVDENVLQQTWVVNSTRNLGLQLGHMLRPPQPVQAEKVIAPLIYWDPLTAQSVFSFSQLIPSPTPGSSDFWVLGLDVAAHEVLKGLAQFSTDEHEYAVLVERSGSQLDVIFHPQVFSESKYSRFALVDVENLQEWSTIYQQVLTQDHGHVTASRKVEFPLDAKGRKAQTVQLTWKLLAPTQYIALLIQTVEEVEPVHFDESQMDPTIVAPPFVHPQSAPMCRLYQSISAIGQSSLHLSPQAFVSATEFLLNPNWRISTMAYLADRTNFVSNPGLKAGAKSDALVLGQIADEWKKGESRNVPHLIRRYVATNNGIMVTYPGQMDSIQDFMAESWFFDAMKTPGQVFISSPLLDPSGAGYIVKLSVATPSTPTAPSITLGADVSLHFLDSFVTNYVDECKSLTVKCFLFAHDGYLAHHPVMTDPAYVGALSDVHILQQEPKIGKDLMHQDSFAQKLFCKNMQTATIESYYKFKDVPAYPKHARYNVTPLESSDLFLVTVNLTQLSKSGSNVFCPCNINSQRCLYCPHDLMEALHSCECPCECPLRQYPCPDHKQRYTAMSELPMCSHTGPPRMFNPSPIKMDSFTQAEFMALPNCVQTECSSFINKQSCETVPECAWCQLELEIDPELGSPSFIPLSRPFCGDNHVCFRGTIGAASPYDVHKSSKMLRDRGGEMKETSAVGSIAGGIVVFFIFMAFSVFCYRHRQTGNSGVCGGRRVFRTSEAFPTRTNTHSIEDDEVHEAGHFNSGLALNCVEVSNVISPYKMNTEYRRPPPPAVTDSDPGYSTVTPMGDIDSDIASTRVGRLHQRMRPPPSQQSVTSGISSRGSSPTPSSSVTSPLEPSRHSKLGRIYKGPSQKLLPECDSRSELLQETHLSQAVHQLQPNQILVAATVHRGADV